MQVSNADRRMNYDVAMRLLKEFGYTKEQANPAYSYLRIEQPIPNGFNQVQMPLLQQQAFNNAVIAPTERRLALQDSFVVGSKGFFIYFRSTITGRPVSPLLTGFTVANAPAGYAWGSILQIWGGGAAVNGLMNEFWYSGWMKYTMDYDVILPYYDVLQHFYIPETQATRNTTVGLDPTLAPFTPYAWTMPEFDGLSDGFMPMEPNIVLGGAKNSEIIFNMPISYTYADLGWDGAGIVDGTIEPRLVCIYRGVLLQNTTNVR